ncbi:MAG: hypothetical protein WB774_12535 [Xanthobacteraceae bacterium]
MDASRPEATDQTAAVQSKEISESGPQKVFADIEQKAMDPKAMEPKAKPKIEIDAERIRTSIARLTSNSIGELEGLASELQKLDEFIKFETDRIQHDIDSLLSGIKIIVETISPWKRSATVSSAPMGPERTVLGSGRGREDMRRTPASG